MSKLSSFGEGPASSASKRLLTLLFASWRACAVSEGADPEEGRFECGVK